MKIVITFIVIIGISISNSLAKTLGWFEGTWVGTGYQVDGQSWTVEFVKEGKTLSISYPSLGCQGNWIVLKATKNRIDIRENITEGTDKCDQGCEIAIFRLDKDQISVVYSLPSFQQHAIATSVLVKRQ